MENKAIDYKMFKRIIESSHLNFLIGSGASKPFLDTLKDIEIALDNIDKREGLEKEQNDKDVLDIINTFIKRYYFKKCIQKNLDLLSADNGSNNTFVAYKSLLQSIQTILSQRSTNIISNQVNLFTTNVDVFLDLTLEELGFAYNDGFSGRTNLKFGTENYHNIINKISSYYEYQYTLPLFNLFKLHGSLNWKYDSQIKHICFDSKLETTEKALESSEEIEDSVQCFDEKGNFKNLKDLYKEAEEHKRKLEEQGEFDKYKKRLEDFREGYDKIIIVNPRKEKFEETTLKLSYYELLRMYSNNLEKENSVLLVMGFSFADEHICNLTLRVAKSNPTLLIIIFAFDENAQKEIANRLGEHPNIRYAVREENFTLKEANNTFFKKLSDELILPVGKENVETKNEDTDGQ